FGERHDLPDRRDAAADRRIDSDRIPAVEADGLGDLLEIEPGIPRRNDRHASLALELAITLDIGIGKRRLEPLEIERSDALADPQCGSQVIALLDIEHQRDLAIELAAHRLAHRQVALGIAPAVELDGAIAFIQALADIVDVALVRMQQ